MKRSASFPGALQPHNPMNNPLTFAINAESMGREAFAIVVHEELHQPTSEGWWHIDKWDHIAIATLPHGFELRVRLATLGYVC